MKGFGMYSINNVGWIEKDRPACGPTDVICRPLAVAPCSSDTHVSHGGGGPFENRILGHESVGEVVEVGSEVKNFKPGDKVIVNCCTPDWEAPLLQDGFDNNAHDYGFTASFKFVMQKDGVFAEYYHVNNADGNLFLMPDDISIEDALMTTDMMSTGFHAVENADIHYGDNVVVFGIGPVGLMAVAGTALAGAGRIYAIGTRPNGCISNVNFFDPSEVFNYPAILWGLGMSNISIKCGFCPGGARRIERLVRMVEADRVHPGKLLNYKFEGFEKIEDAFHLMDEKPKDLIKPYVLI